MSQGKRGRPPLPPGFVRIYFNASPDDMDYLRRVQEARAMATRGAVLRLIVSDARITDRFLVGNDANIAELQS